MDDTKRCTRCGQAIEWDRGDLAWATVDHYGIICVEGNDPDGADALGHTVEA